MTGRGNMRPRRNRRQPGKPDPLDPRMAEVAAVVRRLSVMQGLIQPGEGLRLASIAADVPPEAGIVELGSHTGLSTCWLGNGSRLGAGAHVFAIDPWGDPRPGSKDDPFDLVTGNAVLERFMGNLTAEHLWDRVSIIRTTSTSAAAQRFVLGLPDDVGLLFVDAVHEYDHVVADLEAWVPSIPTNGYLACHDYFDDPACTIRGDVARAIDDTLDPDEWEVEPFLAGSGLWVGRRR